MVKTPQQDPREVGKTGLLEISPEPSPSSLDLVEKLDRSSGNRNEIPMRNSFVRTTSTDQEATPLSQLVAQRAGVALKLYLALIWRSAKAPYDSNIKARVWAQLLDLEDPAGAGARRVRDALDILEAHKLIHTTPNWGEPPTVTLLREDSTGEPYTVPWKAYNNAKKDAQRRRSQYFKIPVTLWSSGHLQGMSASAVAMLLVLLEETREPNATQWWSTEIFDERFRLKKDVRTNGSRELVRRRLLLMSKTSVGTTPGASNPFAKSVRTRNTYQLIGAAVQD